MKYYRLYSFYLTNMAILGRPYQLKYFTIHFILIAEMYISGCLKTLVMSLKRHFSYCRFYNILNFLINGHIKMKIY